MVKKMLINATHPEEYRVAIVEDGILSEFDIEVAGHESTRGNIYKGVVVRVESGLQAAFVDFGAERMGFLQMGEIHPSYFRAWREKAGDKGGRPRITDLFHRGQEILVQIVKEERGTKGAALTTYLSLAGRFMVLMPDSDTRGVSRKIEEEGTRKKLKQTMNSLDLPEQMGYIVRTAAIGQKKEELQRDFNYLLRLYLNIQTLSSQVKSPALIYRESNLIIRSIRDYFTADMDEVLVDDTRIFEETRTFFQEVMPEFARLVKLHQERRPIFNRYQIEEQIETISKNRVPLPSGGSIVIDATEALVAVDVNSGKLATEQGVEGTAIRTNLEAAEEVARQLRLRDLGGLIVVDFIDMRDRKNVRAVEKCLRDALKRDKARTTVGRISQFGLLEMSRQRIKSVLAEATFRFCPTCHGTGKIKSPEAQAIAFLRRLHAGVAKNQISRVEGEVPLDVAAYLLNTKRDELMDLEKRHQVTIYIKGRPDLGAGQADLQLHKRESEIPAPEAVVNEPVSAEARIESPPQEEPPKAEVPGGEQEPESEPKARKRSRRRHRGKRKEGLETGTEDTVRSEAVEDPPGDPATVPAEVDQSSGSVVSRPLDHPDHPEPGTADSPKPKRKRYRGRRKPEEPAGGHGVAQSSGTEVTPPITSEVHHEASAVDPPLPVQTLPESVGPPPTENADASPKGRRPRRSRKKVSPGESAPAAHQPDNSTAPAVPDSVEAGPPEPKPAKNPARARKKRSPSPETAGAPTSQPGPPAESPASPAAIPGGSEGAATQASGGEETVPAAKPAQRRRRPAAKKKPGPDPVPADSSPSD